VLLRSEPLDAYNRRRIEGLARRSRRLEAGGAGQSRGVLRLARLVEELTLRTKKSLPVVLKHDIA